MAGVALSGGDAGRGGGGAGCVPWLLKLPPDDLVGVVGTSTHHTPRAASLCGGPEPRLPRGPVASFRGFLESLAQNGGFFRGF